MPMSIIFLYKFIFIYMLRINYIVPIKDSQIHPSTHLILFAAYIY